MGQETAPCGFAPETAGAEARASKDPAWSLKDALRRSSSPVS